MNIYEGLTFYSKLFKGFAKIEKLLPNDTALVRIDHEIAGRESYTEYWSEDRIKSGFSTGEFFL